MILNPTEKLLKKLPSVSETDLARFAVLPVDRQVGLLKGYRVFSGRVPTYKALRATTPDILNIGHDLFGEPKPTDIRAITRLIIKRVHTPRELRMNVRTARALYTLAQNHGLTSRKEFFPPFVIRAGIEVSYSLPLISNLHSEPFTFFIDPRNQHRLDETARRFVFSMMHERTRELDPDFQSLNLGIIQFNNSFTTRTAQLYSDKGLSLFSMDELRSMINTTYNLWEEIWNERQYKGPPASTGTHGLF